MFIPLNRIRNDVFVKSGDKIDKQEIISVIKKIVGEEDISSRFGMYGGRQEDPIKEWARETLKKIE